MRHKTRRYRQRNAENCFGSRIGGGRSGRNRPRRLSEECVGGTSREPMTSRTAEASTQAAARLFHPFHEIAQHPALLTHVELPVNRGRPRQAARQGLVHEVSPGVWESTSAKPACVTRIAAVLHVTVRQGEPGREADVVARGASQLVDELQDAMG